MIRIVLAAVLCFSMTSAFGQQGPSTDATTVGAPAVASAIAPGIYRGRLTEKEGSRSSDFELDLSQSPGTITVYRAVRACVSAPISVIGVKDGIVRLESKEGVIRGCERVFELTVSGNELTGTLIGPSGTFNVKASKQ